jgi:hypothetical protein
MQACIERIAPRLADFDGSYSSKARVLESMETSERSGGCAMVSVNTGRCQRTEARAMMDFDRDSLKKTRDAIIGTFMACYQQGAACGDFQVLRPQGGGDIIVSVMNRFFDSSSRSWRADNLLFGPARLPKGSQLEQQTEASLTPTGSNAEEAAALRDRRVPLALAQLAGAGYDVMAIQLNGDRFVNRSDFRLPTGHGTVISDPRYAFSRVGFGDTQNVPVWNGWRADRRVEPIRIDGQPTTQSMLVGRGWGIDTYNTKLGEGFETMANRYSTNYYYRSLTHFAGGAISGLTDPTNLLLVVPVVGEEVAEARGLKALASVLSTVNGGVDVYFKLQLAKLPLEAAGTLLTSERPLYDFAGMAGPLAGGLTGYYGLRSGVRRGFGLGRSPVPGLEEPSVAPDKTAPGESLPAAAAVVPPAPAQLKPPREQVLANAALEPAQRIAGAKKAAGLSDEQARAVLDAHEKGGCAVYGCSKEQLSRIADVLKKAGLTAEQRRIVVENGFAGALPETAKGDEVRIVRSDGSIVRAIVADVRDGQAHVAYADGGGKAWNKWVPLDRLLPLEPPAVKPADVVYFSRDGVVHEAVVTALDGNAALLRYQLQGVESMARVPIAQLRGSGPLVPPRVAAVRPPTVPLPVKGKTVAYQLRPSEGLLLRLVQGDPASDLVARFTDEGLWVLETAGGTRRLPPGEAVTVGRGDASRNGEQRVVVADGKVSRDHLTLRTREDGRIEIVESSTNGSEFMLAPLRRAAIPNAPQAERPTTAPKSLRGASASYQLRPSEGLLLRLEPGGGSDVVARFGADGLWSLEAGGRAQRLRPGEEVTVGRRSEPRNGERRLVVGGDLVSRDHLTLRAREDGRIEVRETSSNGTDVMLAPARAPRPPEPVPSLSPAAKDIYAHLEFYQQKYGWDAPKAAEMRRIADLMIRSGRSQPLVPERNFIDSVGKIPPQGIKLRVVDPGSAAARERLLGEFLAILAADRALSDKVHFKVSLDMDVMTGDQAGKFITIYTLDPGSALQLAQALDAKLQGMTAGNAVAPPQEFIFGSSGLVTWRAGAFTSYEIRVDGNAFRDIRQDPVLNLRRMASGGGFERWVEMAGKSPQWQVWHLMEELAPDRFADLFPEAGRENGATLTRAERLALKPYERYEMVAHGRLAVALMLARLKTPSLR